jgi:hypothetical protein
VRKEGRKEGRERRGEDGRGERREGDQGGAAWPVVVVVLVLTPD